MRVKKDGKLSNAATEFSHEAARPMFSLGILGAWRIGPAQNMIRNGWTAFWAGWNRGRGIREFWGRANADAG
jgi:hypothetical protein